MIANVSSSSLILCFFDSESMIPGPMILIVQLGAQR